MVSLSKLFHDPFNRVPCQALYLHIRDYNCTQMLLWNCYRFLISSSKYFFPLLISPLVLKFRHLKRQAMLNVLRQYVESVVWGGISSALTFYFICLLRTMFGKFYKYTGSFIPTYLAFQLVWFYPKSITQVFTVGISQASLETMVSHLNTPLTNALSDSKMLQTLLFMLSSGIILHFKRHKTYKGFWFVPEIPLKPKEATTSEMSTSHKTCKIHTEPRCASFVLQGMRKMLLYGLPLDLLHLFIKGKKPKNLRDVLTRFKKLRFNMTAFFLCYIGLYRSLTCILYRHFSNHTSELQHFSSAMLSGVVYLFVRRMTFCILSLILAVQSTWQHFCLQKTNEDNAFVPKRVIALLKRIPFGRLMIPVGLGYLVHVYLFHNHAVSNLGRGFLLGVTDRKILHIYEKLETANIANILEHVKNCKNAL